MNASSLTAAQVPEIRLLDNHTVNQIAAGEVVERPSSALKELIENALDAQATRITISLIDSGRTLIEVADNGHGMTESSARLALLRHATSKITSADDLLAIASYGFRGEALPSIASVSHLTLSTGTIDGARTVITVRDGTINTPTTQPGPRGTTIRVEHLFGTLPARLKFLKSDVTELNQCIDAVSRFALLRPDVAFTLNHNEGVLLRTTGSGDPLAALADVWSPEIARALVPLATSNGYAVVSGFISPPHLTKPTRSLQWLFVNGRPVRSKTLTAALDQAVRSLTPDRRYPIAALFLDLNPAEIDVNVSPTKSEVKFHREGGVFDAVRRAIKDALLTHGMVPSVADLAAVNTALSAHQPSFPLHDFATSIQPTPEQLPVTSADLLEDLRILGQIDQTFIIAENATSLLLIDQHVAHERILYEMLLNTRGQAPIERQPLLDPATLSVGRRLLPLLLDHLAEFAAMGFDLEPFGPDSLLVRTVPALGRGRTPLTILQDMIDEIAEGTGTAGWTPTRDDVYIMCSCKMAIKAGDPLGHAEMRKLIEDLAQTENPYLCPHGRPITIAWPKGDLRRRFKR
jgi:DNA mismatch repair protein MutL